MRLDRLLAIVIKLLNRNRISARDLAHDFEVTIRTIYRDIEAINLAGIPIISYPGQQGGFGIVENFRVDRQILNLQDIISISSILKGFQATFPDRKMDIAAEKLRNLLPKDKALEINREDDQIVIDILPWGSNDKQKKHLNLIQQAISEKHTIKFFYRNSRGENAVRTVEPMTLIFKAYAWYLFGYCQLKKDYRVFKLTRISQLKIQKNTFKRRGQTYQKFQKRDQSNSVKKITLTLKFSPQIRFRVEDMFMDSHLKIAQDGSATVHITWPDDDGLYTFLLGFGNAIEVLNPVSVRKKLIEKSKEIIKLYQ